MQTWYVPLIIHIPIQVPLITEYHRRKQWQDRYSGEGVTIVGIYNTGRNLFFDQCYSSAITHYEHRWSWLQFRNFCVPKFVLANKKHAGGRTTKLDLIVLQLLGHNDSNTASVRTRSSWTGADYSTCYIPPRRILYLAVKQGNIVGRLLVYQHLPIKLFQTFGGLETFPDFKLVK